MNREEAFLGGLKAGKITWEDGLIHKHDIFDTMNQQWTLANSNPLGLHALLFVPFIRNQATTEQCETWIPQCESGEIIGCYAQTELGHGTFVRGIETTATLDEMTDEFIIHSPTFSSSKYWPGALGFTATHAIVMARLISKAQDHGVHAFMVQIRSPDSHKPSPGVELGDIGLKMAYNGTDNGYARFDQVRIPRTNLFMKSCHISRQGVYKASKNREKLLYGGMLRGRRIITRNAAFKFAQALTIAIRYSTVREQGQGSVRHANLKLGEAVIMSYKHQNYRLLSNLAKAYATLFASRYCNDAHRIHQQKVEKDDYSDLPYMHMLTSGLKAWATQTAADGAEDVRRCCGGHGYIMISGLPEIFSSLTALTTLEGENYVMWQQVAKYLMNNISHKVLPEGMSYMQRRSSSGLHEKCKAQGNEFRSCEVLLGIYEHRSARLATEVAAMMTDPSNVAKTDVWNTYLMQLFSAARAHIEVIILRSFIGHVDRIIDDATKTVLSRLTSLFALTGITGSVAIDAIGFVEDGHLSSYQLRDIRSQIDDLLSELIPDAIALTDAWNFTDASLCSAIGMKNGNAYETIMQWTRQLPINANAGKTADVFAEGFESCIKPVLRGQAQLRERARL
ncbi:hypothetical protein ACMFMG_010618 [Clarireedia jacksonii]